MKNIVKLCIFAASLYGTTYGMDQRMQQFQQQREAQIRQSNETVCNWYLNSNQPVPAHVLATVNGGHANLAAIHNQQIAQAQQQKIEEQKILQQILQQIQKK